MARGMSVRLGCSRPMRLLRILIVCFFLLCVDGRTVFLTSLVVYSSRRMQSMEGPMRVYFQCDGLEREDIPDVQFKGLEYTWPPESRFAVELLPGTCKRCGFWERRYLPFTPDDSIGTSFDICEEFFQSGKPGESAVRAAAEGHFSATFACEECAKAAAHSAPPPPPGLPSPQSPEVSAPPLPEPSESVEPAGVANAEAHSVEEAAAGGKEGIRPLGLPLLTIVGIAVGGAALVGFASGLAAFACYRRRQRRRREERERAFEAVFEDPDLDLEAALEEDAKEFNLSLLSPYTQSQKPSATRSSPNK